MEIELKYHFPTAQLSHFWAHPLVQSVLCAPQKKQFLSNVYWDTPDLILSQEKIALRLRFDGEKWFQTVKGAEKSSANGLSRRYELETLLSSGALNWAELDQTPFAALFKAHHTALLPLFSTDFERTYARLQLDETTQVELAIDQGEVKAGTASAPLTELELEWISGSEAVMLAYGERLANTFDLKPNLKSKAAVGFELLAHLPQSK